MNNTFLYSAVRLITTISDGTNVAEMAGTGFFIEKNGVLVLVTNRHMVDVTFRNDPKWAHYKILNMSMDHFISNTGSMPTLTRNNILNFASFVYSPNVLNDIACLPNLVPDKAPQKIDYTIPFSFLGTNPEIIRDVRVCEFIAYTGYPSSGYDQQNKLPIFKMGSIASDPSTNYSPTNTSYGDCVAYEGFSQGGSSGSPVFLLQRGVQLGANLSGPSDFYRREMLIGINAGHATDIFKTEKVTFQDLFTGAMREIEVPITQHSGISWFYKSSAIIDTLSAAGV